MADVPEGIVLKRNRDLESGFHNPWIRRSIVTVLVVFVVLGLANVFGQRPHGIRATAGAATLELYVPSHLRSGVLFEARFTIRARNDLKSAALLLSPGWGEGMSMNTIEPSPVGEASRNGDFLFKLGHIGKGHIFRLFMQFQINPTNVAWRRPADAALYDGNTRILTIHHTVTVFP